jgi:hypothetical protein
MALLRPLKQPGPNGPSAYAIERNVHDRNRRHDRPGTAARRNQRQDHFN